jgi:basic amino acid/polyamine antiporter, APA family
MPTTPQSDASSPTLIRGMGLGSATALNMIDMIGVGPFITMPLVVAAMGGPQALLGWIFGALFAMCDGLVWAELGAAMPGSGGSYGWLREIYGPQRLGKLISFLFIWQLSFSAPLSIASGCIGLTSYAAYFSHASFRIFHTTFVVPSLETVYAQHNAALHLPWAGTLQVSWVVTSGTALSVLICLFTVFLLYRNITVIGRLSKVLWFGVMGTMAWIIFAGITHFNAKQAFAFPPGAFHVSHNFLIGLGSAMAIAAYDYWGYGNVCFLGDEIKDPGKNIPRALLLSILFVACLYIVMNICVMAVVPAQEMVEAAHNNSRLYVISLFMERIYGTRAAQVVTALVIWTAFASVFSLMLGYSRVPYAAAKDGNYFRAFAKVHPVHRFPSVSLAALGVVAAAFCFLRLKDAIAALVVIRIIIQFLVQAVGLIVLRIRRPDMPRPFRMWLYPLPALFASLGFIFILFERANWQREVRYAVLILLTGIVIYMIRAWRSAEWPFAAKSEPV